MDICECPDGYARTAEVSLSVCIGECQLENKKGGSEFPQSAGILKLELETGVLEVELHISLEVRPQLLRGSALQRSTFNAETRNQTDAKLIARSHKCRTSTTTRTSAQ